MGKLKNQAEMWNLNFRQPSFLATDAKINLDNPSNPINHKSGEEKEIQVAQLKSETIAQKLTWKSIKVIVCALEIDEMNY